MGIHLKLKEMKRRKANPTAKHRVLSFEEQQKLLAKIKALKEAQKIKKQQQEQKQKIFLLKQKEAEEKKKPIRTAAKDVKAKVASWIKPNKKIIIERIEKQQPVKARKEEQIVGIKKRVGSISTKRTKKRRLKKIEPIKSKKKIRAVTKKTLFPLVLFSMVLPKTKKGSETRTLSQKKRRLDSDRENFKQEKPPSSEVIKRWRRIKVKNSKRNFLLLVNRRFELKRSLRSRKGYEPYRKLKEKIEKDFKELISVFDSNEKIVLIKNLKEIFKYSSKDNELFGEIIEGFKKQVLKEGGMQNSNVKKEVLIESEIILQVFENKRDSQEVALFKNNLTKFKEGLKEDFYAILKIDSQIAKVGVSPYLFNEVLLTSKKRGYSNSEMKRMLKELTQLSLEVTKIKKGVDSNLSALSNLIREGFEKNRLFDLIKIQEEIAKKRMRADLIESIEKLKAEKVDNKIIDELMKLSEKALKKEVDLDSFLKIVNNNKKQVLEEYEESLKTLIKEANQMIKFSLPPENFVSIGRERVKISKKELKEIKKEVLNIITILSEKKKEDEAWLFLKLVNYGINSSLLFDYTLKDILKKSIYLSKMGKNPSALVDATEKFVSKGFIGKKLDEQIEVVERFIQKGLNAKGYPELIIALNKEKELDLLLKLNDYTISVIGEEVSKGFIISNREIKRRTFSILKPEFVDILNLKIMQRSENRIRRFITPIMENEATAEQTKELIQSKLEKEGKISKKQAKELPYITQSLALLNMLGTKPVIKGTNFKEIKQQLKQQVIKAGTEKYGEAFKRKYKQLTEEKAEHRMYETLNAIEHLKNNYTQHGFKKEQQILNEVFTKWLEGKQTLEQYKYNDLQKLQAPKQTTETWKQTIKLEKTIQPNEKIDKKEILKRLNESLNELKPEQKQQVKQEYEKIKQLIQTEEYEKAQTKTQKLAKKIKELNEDAARHLNQTTGLMIQTSTTELNLEVTDSLRLNTWLNAGETFGTCQSYTSTREQNRALVSFIGDGTKKVIGVYDKETGEIKARGIMHLVKNTEGEWELYLDDIYSHIPGGVELINEFFEQKAKQLGIGITNKPAEIYGKTPYTYMDNAGKLIKQETVK